MASETPRTYGMMIAFLTSCVSCEGLQDVLQYTTLHDVGLLGNPLPLTGNWDHYCQLIIVCFNFYLCFVFVFYGFFYIFIYVYIFSYFCMLLCFSSLSCSLDKDFLYSFILFGFTHCVLSCSLFFPLLLTIYFLVTLAFS